MVRRAGIARWLNVAEGEEAKASLRFRNWDRHKVRGRSVEDGGEEGASRFIAGSNEEVRCSPCSEVGEELQNSFLESRAKDPEVRLRRTERELVAPADTHIILELLHNEIANLDGGDHTLGVIRDPGEARIRCERLMSAVPHRHWGRAGDGERQRHRHQQRGGASGEAG